MTDKGALLRSSLFFAGKRWRSISVTKSAAGFEIKKMGAGRRYEMHGPECWWRDLAELDFSDAEAIRRFVMRRGDPSGSLERDGKTKISWSEWIADGLRPVAEAWPSAGADGVSRISDDQWRIRAAQAHLRILAPRMPDRDGFNRLSYHGEWIGLDVIAGDDASPLGLTISARTMAAYLLASANYCLAKRTTMRRCQYCAGWFNASVRRSDAGFCSGSCQVMFFRERHAA